MPQVLPPMPPGFIGLPSGEISRYSDFIPSLVPMVASCPPGTLFQKVSGLGTAAPLNSIARSFVQQPNLRWLFLTNDDNLCQPDTIRRLWARLQDPRVDVVSGLYFSRLQPFEPILFDKVEKKEFGGVMRNWYIRHLMQPGESGMIRATAVGDGCLMIKRRVMLKLTDPWWEYGETFSDQCDHDVTFSRKVTEAGFGLWCDLDVRVDHVAAFAVRPVRAEDGSWQAHLVQAEGRSIVLPAAYKEGE